ncbi:hypothetical protein [Microvirga lenta]|uniref:hypothetical protein n=1 Tax=Microvirga lenta TaxID=2881337 RepID=UPI001CFFDA0B|nr:hypothetical protein [Microvirga lenta]MCB5177141.1 hypothetical protein [Microvirga lenta]
MDQPYSVVADWLSKFHTWPMLIQALWLVAGPVTVLGLAWIAARTWRDIAALRHGDGPLYGLPREWEGPLLTYRGGRLAIAQDQEGREIPDTFRQAAQPGQGPYGGGQA